MRICAVVKYPPIQGGVSARSYWIARALAMRGHEVRVVTNAGETEADYRLWIPPEDRELLEASFDNGGRVTVVSTGRDRRRLAHIPQSNPFVTKLSALACEQIRQHDCDVVFSYYYEPYGISAHLASTWVGVPHVVQHAGSDRGRLMSHPDLAVAYRELLRPADIVVTADRSLEGLGIEPERFARVPGGFLPSGHFTPSVPALDVDELLSRVRAHPFVRNSAPSRADLPTVGVLGKVGEVKGSYDLIAALARLSARGVGFNLLAMVAGPERERFLAAVDAAGLGSRTWTLPLLPHWRVGEFMRACTAVCFLERRFPIAAHTPNVPLEIMASGVCAVLSREIADKQRWSIHGGKHAIVVDDPSDIDELATALLGVFSDDVNVQAIAAAGAALVTSRDESDLGRAYETILKRAVDYRSRPAPVSTAAAVHAFLTKQMPGTARLFADEIAKAVHNVSEPGGPALVAYRVAESLWREESGRSIDDPRLHVLAYERELIWLAVDIESPSGVPMFPAPTAMLWHRDGAQGAGASIPVRSNWLRISRHPSDIEAVSRAVSAGDTQAARCAGEPVMFLFQKRGDLSKRVFRVGDATVALIDLCDGSNSVDQIAAKLADRAIAARQQVSHAIQRLVRDQVLAVIPGPPDTATLH
jgi:glycosyltransferase involved in cell wall biosynthesis